MTLTALAARAGADQLDIFGAFHLSDSETLALLGPREPGFWATLTAAPEWQDRQPDPVDRWSKRVIDAIAADIGGRALYPFGAPAQPFLTWAIESGRAWSSPVMLLVHDAAGLMVSYRGAVILPGHLPLGPPSDKPCATCAGQPCTTACPVGALTTDGYDLPACHAFLDTEAGQDCMTRGCAVRRACPVSHGYARTSEQSAYHMSQFHP